MASFLDYFWLWIEAVIEIFQRFIYSGGDIDDVENKAVFITGCDTGFGHQMALSLNDRGYTVFAGCLFPDRDGSRSLLIKAMNATKMHIIQIDVTNDLTISNALDEVKRKLLHQKVILHAIVNNAGVCYFSETEWGSFDTIFRHTMEVNTMGMVMVTRTFLPLIRESKGRIININSVAARYSVPGLVSYCMSKHASRAFTEGLRREMKKFGVRVTSVEPYFYATAMCDNKRIGNVTESTWRDSDPEVRRSYGERYLKIFVKGLDGLNPLVEQDTTPVIDAVVHACTNKYPLYHYTCASFVIYFFLNIGHYIYPQETFEYLVNQYLLICKRTKPFPDEDEPLTRESME